MAEAAVDNRSTSHRFYCHICSTEINPTLPDFTCPRCEKGFVEEITDDFSNSAPSQPVQEPDPAVQFAELWGRTFLENFRNQSTRSRENRDSDDEDDRQRQSFIPRARLSVRRSRSDRNNVALERLLHHLIAPLTGENAQAGLPINVFPLHGNLGDYAWGASGLDAVITQLLNQLEGSGAPPADKDKIDSLPLVRIRNEDKGMQCSICMEDFQIDEEVRKLPCQHHYHSNCIIKWLELHGNCPICRKDLNGADTSTNEFNTMPPPGSGSSDSSSSEMLDSLPYL